MTWLCLFSIIFAFWNKVVLVQASKVSCSESTAIQCVYCVDKVFLGSWTTELCRHITPTTSPFCTPGKMHLHQVPNHTVRISGAVWIFQVYGFCCLVLSYITMCQIISWPDSITHNNSFNGVVGYCWCHQGSSKDNQYSEHKHKPHRQWQINYPNEHSLWVFMQ